MPLSDAQPRTLHHTRTVSFRGYARDDGLWDIEAHLCDAKPHAFEIPGEGTWAPHEPVHDMAIRLTVDAHLVVRAIEASMDAVPHDPCPGALPSMQGMVGVRLGAGWRQAIDRNLRGAAGCTHLRELLFSMATAAFQTLPDFPVPDDPARPPLHLGKCVGWDFNGPVVEREYPMFFRWQPPARGAGAPPAPGPAAPEPSARS